MAFPFVLVSLRSLLLSCDGQPVLHALVFGGDRLSRALMLTAIPLTIPSGPVPLLSSVFGYSFSLCVVAPAALSAFPRWAKRWRCSCRTC